MSTGTAATAGPAPTGGQAMRPSFSASPSFWIATRLPSATLCAFATFVLTFVALQQSNEVIQQQNQEQVYEWLEKSGLGKHKETVFQHVCHSLVDCASRDEASWGDAVIALNRRGLPSDASAAFRLAAGRLRSRLVLLRWLRAHYAEQTTTDAVTAPTPPPPPPPPLAARHGDDGDKEARVPSSSTSSPTTQPNEIERRSTRIGYEYYVIARLGLVSSQRVERGSASGSGPIAEFWLHPTAMTFRGGRAGRAEAFQRPAAVSIAEAVREEVHRALLPEVPVAVGPERPVLTCAAAAKREPPVKAHYQPAPRREAPAPQYAPRPEQRGARKTDVWRTADRRPMCYHCGEADHIYRRCPYRQLGLR
ncbi:hypothetical protein HPB47_028049, partial [Ixodes persulcatus]